MATAAPRGRVSSGVPGLDRMLNGGLIAGRPYLVSGATGSGKTILGLQFLLEGIRVGEPVLIVAVDEPPHEILENVRNFGWDLSKIRTLDANPGMQAFRRLGDVQEIRALHDVKTMQDIGESRKAQQGEEISIQSIYLKLRRQMEILPFKRVLIDSMSSIRHFAIRGGGEVQSDRTEIQSLLRFLSEKKATTLLTALPSPPEELTPEEVLCRGEIALERVWQGPVTQRRIRIVRCRGTAHDTDSHVFTIGSDGIHVEGVASPDLGR